MHLYIIKNNVRLYHTIDVTVVTSRISTRAQWLLLLTESCAYLISHVLTFAEPDPIQELVYDLRSQCDAIRVTKTVRPFTMVCCPVNENSAALIVSDGRVMIWELKSTISGRSQRTR